MSFSAQIKDETIGFFGTEYFEFQITIAGTELKEHICELLRGYNPIFDGQNKKLSTLPTLFATPRKVMGSEVRFSLLIPKRVRYKVVQLFSSGFSEVKSDTETQHLIIFFEAEDHTQFTEMEGVEFQELDC